MKDFEYNVDFILPDAIDNIKEKSIASFGSSILFNKTIPGIFLFCDNEYLIKAGIDKKELIEVPVYKLKMIKSGSHPNLLVYLFEIELIHKNGHTTRIHFNPREKSFRDFCLLGTKSKMISIHYCTLDSTLMPSVHIEIEDENIDWLERNFLVSKQIKYNSAYTVLIDIVKQQFPKSEYFIQNKKPIFLDVHKNKS
jgi:hypothetical protein